MPETHLSMSEIVSGRILQGDISVDVVRPDLFAFPYDKLISFMQSNQNVEREDIVRELGVGPFNSAMEAAEATNGYKVDWVSALEKTMRRENLANVLEKASKQLKSGKQVEYPKIIETIHSVENSEMEIENLDNIKIMKNPFIPTGWESWDNHMVGIPRVGMTILGGETKHGKTTCAIKVAASFVREHPELKVLFLTLEMSKGQLKGRIKQLEPSLNKEQRSRLLIADQLWDINQLPNKCASVNNLGLVVLDNVDWVVKENSEQAHSEVYHVCSKLGKQLYIPTLVLCQYGYRYKGGIPHPTHVKFTSAAMQLCSMSALIYNANKDLLTDNASISLPPITGKSYICYHLARDGFVKHLSDNPGAIMFDYSEKYGWGEGGRWIKLKP